MWFCVGVFNITKCIKFLFYNSDLRVYKILKVSDIDAITRLLSLGADVALKNRDGQDASAVAAQEGNAELAQRLRRLRAGGHIPVSKDWVEYLFIQNGGIKFSCRSGQVCVCT